VKGSSDFLQGEFGAGGSAFEASKDEVTSSVVTVAILEITKCSPFQVSRARKWEKSQLFERDSEGLPRAAVTGPTGGG